MVISRKYSLGGRDFFPLWIFYDEKKAPLELRSTLKEIYNRKG